MTLILTIMMMIVVSPVLVDLTTGLNIADRAMIPDHRIITTIQISPYKGRAIDYDT